MNQNSFYLWSDLHSLGEKEENKERKLRSWTFLPHSCNYSFAQFTNNGQLLSLLFTLLLFHSSSSVFHPPSSHSFLFSYTDRWMTHSEWVLVVDLNEGRKGWRCIIGWESQGNRKIFWLIFFTPMPFRIQHNQLSSYSSSLSLSYSQRGGEKNHLSSSKSSSTFFLLTHHSSNCSPSLPF